MLYSIYIFEGDPYKSYKASVLELNKGSIMKISLVLSLLIFNSFFSRAFASGCGSNYFYSGEIKNQKTILNLGEVNNNEAQSLIQLFSQKFKHSLFYWSKTPVVVSPVKIEIIETAYQNLDTDCGWSYFGSELSITQLKINTGDSIVSYPDLYKDISAEDSLNSGDFIRISK